MRVAEPLAEPRAASYTRLSPVIPARSQEVCRVDVVPWIMQALLALAFVTAGALKVSLPREALAKAMPWTAAMPLPVVRLIGTAELLGALGLILPALTRIAPVLTPAAAGGLVIVMFSAIAFHATRKEYRQIGGNILLLVLAAFFVYGRLALAPIVG